MTLHYLAQTARDTALVRRTGRVVRYHGLLIESQGPDVSVGEACEISVPGREAPLRAEVVGVRDGTAQLMPYGEVIGLGVGVEVTATGKAPRIPLGEGRPTGHGNGGDRYPDKSARTLDKCGPISRLA